MRIYRNGERNLKIVGDAGDTIYTEDLVSMATLKVYSSEEEMYQKLKESAGRRASLYKRACEGRSRELGRQLRYSAMLNQVQRGGLVDWKQVYPEQEA